jgi:transcriptional regulator with XRE-family HTH domain
MIVQSYNIGNLVPHPDNSKYFDDIDGDEWVQFKGSIQSEGILTPLIVSPDLTVISGHQRIRACKELDIDMVPVIIRQDLTTKEEKLVALLVSNFGRRRNNGEKDRLVVVEYVKLRGNARGGDRKSNSDCRSLKLTQAEIAKELGLTVTALNEILSIETNLTPEIKQMLSDGFFTKTTASKVLTKLSKEEQAELMNQFGKEIINGVTQSQMKKYADEIVATKRSFEQQLKEIEDGYEDQLAALAEDIDNQETSALLLKIEALEQKYREEYEKRKDVEKTKDKALQEYKEMEQALTAQEDYSRNLSNRLSEIELELSSIRATETPNAQLATGTKEVLFPKPGDIGLFRDACESFISAAVEYTVPTFPLGNLSDDDFGSALAAIRSVMSSAAKINNNFRKAEKQSAQEIILPLLEVSY